MTNISAYSVGNNTASKVVVIATPCVLNNIVVNNVNGSDTFTVYDGIDSSATQVLFSDSPSAGSFYSAGSQQAPFPWKCNNGLVFVWSSASTSNVANVNYTT